MADAPKLLRTDTLRVGYPKINQGIDNANEALKKSLTADSTSSTANTTANAANDLSKSVKTQLDQLVISGSIDPETKQARVNATGVAKTNLKERIDDDYNKLTVDISNKASKSHVSKVVGYYYNPEIPEAIDYTKFTPNQFYQMLEIEPYKSHPHFTNTVLGKDQSGQYDIKLYKFEPKSYEKTVFLVGSIHGWENFGTYAIVELFKMLLGSEELLPAQFKYIKDKVRVLAIPSVNPWGMYQNPKTRQNSNGVDINRNFDWNWANNKVGQPWDYDYKGTAPFSEKESQYVKKVFDSYKGEITAFLDLHHQSYSNQWDYLVYPDDNMYKEFNVLLGYLTRNLSNPVVVNTVGYNDSSSNNYASKVIGIPSATIESIIGRFGAVGSEVDNNKWFEFVFNSILMATINFKNLQGVSVRNRFKTYADGAVVLVNNISTDLTDSVFTFTPPSNGYVEAKGCVIAKQSNADDIISSRIVSEQPGYLVQTSSFPNTYTSGKLPVIPLNISIPVVKGKPVNIKIVAMNEGSGVCNIKRFTLNIVYQTAQDIGLFSPGSMEGYTFV